MNYLVEILITSALLFVGYRFITPLSSYSFRRVYLLLWLVLSVTLPLIELPTHYAPAIQVWPSSTTVATSGVEVERMEELTDSNPSTYAYLEPQHIMPAKSQSSAYWLWYGYAGVSFLLLVRMFLSLLQVLRLKRKGCRTSDYYTLNESSFVGASFFRWVFIGTYVKHQSIVLAHEQTHARLWHSADVLLSELYVCLLWWNPFGWYVRKAIRVNAEFETDEYMAQQYGKANYSLALIDLGNHQTRISLASSFGDASIKSRILALGKSGLKSKNSAIFSTFLLFGFIFWLVSCAKLSGDSLDPIGVFDDVRTVTTRFESHQGDTRQKDDKVVAVAHFLPDGTLDKVVQHMTYPYDYARAFDRTFWAAPIKANLSHLMDGLDLGDAEKNLLYGNDWPVVFEQFVKENGHPNGMRFEGFKSTTEVKYQDNLPVEIETVPDGTIPFGAGYIDQFTYEKGKVSSNVSYLNSRLRLKVSEGKIVSDGVEELVQVNKKNVLFKYDGDKLIKVDQGDQVFRFFYEGDQLIRSEFLVREKLYNTRKYSYNDAGLKTKTEVFNVFDEPEYTISYEYTFYE